MKVEKKRLLINSTSFPRDLEDSSGNFVRGMVKVLLKKGYSLKLLIPDDKDEIKLDYFKGDIKVYTVKYAPRRYQTLFYRDGVLVNLKRDPFKIIWLPFFFFNAYRIIKEIIDEVDVILNHWIFPFGFIVSFFGREKRVVSIVHGSDLRLLFSIPMGRYILRKILYSQKIIAVNSRLKEEIEKRFHFDRLDIKVIHMGLDKEEFNNKEISSRDKLMVKKRGKVIIGFIGRLIEEKGVDIVIRAISLLPFKEKICLKIVGRGPLFKQLVLISKILNIDTQFLGEIKRGEIKRFLKEIDILVIPSRESDSSPVVLIEALSLNKIIIASDIEGIKEIGKDFIFYFKREDPLDLANLLKEIIIFRRDEIELVKPIGYALINKEIEKYYWDNHIINFEKVLFEEV